MLGMLGDHLWQSTLVAAAAAVLALAFRRHRANVRYWLWMTASLKFIVPFAALVFIGGQLSWRTVEVVTTSNVGVLVEAMSEPFSQNGFTIVAPPREPAAQSLVAVLPRAFVAIWVLGAVAVLLTWCIRWRRMAAIVRRGSPLATGCEIEIVRRLSMANGVRPLPIVASDTALEPGVFGILHPVLLWPRGIAGRLTGEQVEAILAHEICHLRRRDNLAAALHMLVQALFWFHPLVWWIGSRLVDERERACDEEVVRLGSEPEVYAESILETCKFSVESPLACVAGVTGSDLKKRIEAIMTNDAPATLNPWRKALLAAVGIIAFATPVALGALNPPPQTRELPAPGSLPAFEVISVRPNTTTGRGGRGGGQMQPGRYVAQNLTLRTIVKRAFSRPGSRPNTGIDLFDQQVAGGPEWIDTDKFDIVATTPGPTEPPEMLLMVQRMLAERFNLAAHWEIRELPVYVLTTLRSDGTLGPGLTPTPDSECAKFDPDAPRSPDNPPPCGAIQFGPGQLVARGAPMEWLAQTLTNIPVVTGLDRPVLDRTGLRGNYGFQLKFSPPQAPNPDPERPHLITALEEQLGLKLEATRAPLDVLVIDSAEKPEEN